MIHCTLSRAYDLKGMILGNCLMTLCFKNNNVITTIYINLNFGVIMGEQYSYPTYAKLIHLGMAFFVVFALLTGDFADDCITSNGYLIHSYLGLSLASIILLRVIIGFSSTKALSFKEWPPFSKHQ